MESNRKAVTQSGNFMALNFPVLHSMSGYIVVPIESLFHDIERKTVPLQKEFENLYSITGDNNRRRRCPTCWSVTKERRGELKPKKFCQDKWHKRKPKGWSRAKRNKGLIRGI